jgi:hypothetical protein
MQDIPAGLVPPAMSGAPDSALDKVRPGPRVEQLGNWLLPKVDGAGTYIGIVHTISLRYSGTSYDILHSGIAHSLPNISPRPGLSTHTGAPRHMFQIRNLCRLVSAER